MNDINSVTLEIENLRRRAKDNKAKNAATFAALSESYFDKTRNILFLISFAVLGYLGAVQQSLTDCQTVLLLMSVISGVFSYLSSYRYAWSLSSYYSELEHNLRTAFPSQEQYEEMLSNEPSIDQKHSKRHLPQLLALIFLLIQGVVLFFSLFGILI